MLYYFTHMWNIKKQNKGINKQMNKKQTYKYREKTRVGRGKGWAKWVKGKGRYRLLGME